MNEVAKMNDVGEIVVADPFSPETYHAARDVSALIKSVNNHLVYRCGQFDCLGALDEANVAAVGTLRRALADDDDALKDFEKNLKDALLELSGFKAYVVQTKGAGARIDPLSVRGKIAEMVKQLKAREDAEKPAAPVHTYVLRVTCTDAVLTKLVKAATKDGATDVLFAVPQGDKQVKVIQKWFEENV